MADKLTAQLERMEKNFDLYRKEFAKDGKISKEEAIVLKMVGTKLAGKEGRTSIGALNVLTDPISFAEEDGDSIHIRRTNYSVLRVKRDLFARSNLGFIMVNKQTDGTLDGWNTYNRSAGIDFSYSPTSKLNLQGFAAQTWDSNIEGTGNARFLFLNYRGSTFWSRLKYLDVDENFEPAVGFVNRRGDLTGFRRYNVYLRWRPRPRFGNIRYMSIGPELELYTNRSNDVKYWKGEVSWYTLFNSGDAWSSQLTRFYRGPGVRCIEPAKRFTIDLPVRCQRQSVQKHKL